MSFKLQYHENHTTGLVATCDVCGKQVIAETANILWLPAKKEEPGDCHEYRIACKGDCTHAIDVKCGHQMSQELDTALAYLLSNSKTDVKRAKHKAQLLGMIG